MEYQGESITTQGNFQSQQNLITQQNYQYPSSEQFYQKPQIENQNINQQNPTSQYFIIPEGKSHVKNNELSIPFANKCGTFFLMILYLGVATLVVISAPSFHKIYAAIILLVEMLLVLNYIDKKIIIIKDMEKKRAYVVVKNYLFRTRKKLDFNLENINFNVKQIGTKNILFMVNNFKNENIIDYNTGNSGSPPPKFLYCFENINVDKFNGFNQLNSILNQFINSSKEKENPLYFDIDSYMHKYEEIAEQISFMKYIKINNNYFVYLNDKPVQNESYCPLLFKIISGIMRFYFFGIGISGLMQGDDKERIFLTMFGGVMLFYCLMLFVGFKVCEIKQNNNKKTNLRIDIMFSNDFDKIFVGTSNANEKQLIYINRIQFNINEIDKFILRKNTPNEEGFHLLVLFKNRNMANEICFIKDEPVNLEGLVYILNEKLENNNNYPQGFNNNYIPPNNFSEQPLNTINTNIPPQSNEFAPPPTVY